MSGIELGRKNEMQQLYFVLKALLFSAGRGGFSGHSHLPLLRKDGKLSSMVTKSYFVHLLYSVTSYLSNHIPHLFILSTKYM